MTTPETASFKEFACIAGFRPSYIAQLKADDRLVLTDDGKRVRVAESLQRIEDTKDPSKAGVQARHAAERAAANAPAADAQEIAPSEPKNESDSGFQYWRERSERAKALAAERENAVAEGKLMVAADVAAAVSHSVSVLRTRLESLADILAPQVIAAGDEAKARSIISEAVEHALAETSRQFLVLGKAA